MLGGRRAVLGGRRAVLGGCRAVLGGRQAVLGGRRAVEPALFVGDGAQPLSVSKGVTA